MGACFGDVRSSRKWVCGRCSAALCSCSQLLRPRLSARPPCMPRPIHHQHCCCCPAGCSARRRPPSWRARWQVGAPYSLRARCSVQLGSLPFLMSNHDCNPPTARMYVDVPSLPRPNASLPCFSSISLYLTLSPPPPHTHRARHLWVVRLLCHLLQHLGVPRGGALALVPPRLAEQPQPQRHTGHRYHRLCGLMWVGGWMGVCLDSVCASDRGWRAYMHNPQWLLRLCSGWGRLRKYASACEPVLPAFHLPDPLTGWLPTPLPAPSPPCPPAHPPAQAWCTPTAALPL